MRRPRRPLPLLLALAAVALPLAAPGERASALRASPVVDAGGIPGMVGVDALYAGTGGGGEYDAIEWWDEQGNLLAPLDIPDHDAAGRSLSMVRYEFYPKPKTGPASDMYDPWSVPVGGVHVQRDPWNGSFSDVGVVTLPREGDAHGGFRAEGAVASATPLPDGRVTYDVFQLSYNYPDVGPELPRTSSGADMAAFVTEANRGDRWTAGVTWPGMYTLVIRDTATGRTIQAFTEIHPGSVPTIDLDAYCFGFDICVYQSGGPAVGGGGFHPLSPTRILDTRTGLGIAHFVPAGDGRTTEPNPIMRRELAANHELDVTGIAGIPDSGVAAVLLNVTASGATDPSYVSIFPKPPRTGNLYDDQASYGPLPTTSNLNLTPGIDVPNMVLAPVGAGGKIRIYNFTGATHLIADVAGWVDTSGTVRGGDGFRGVAPTRLLDTRNGVGPGTGSFTAGQERTLQVAGVGDVPADATSVVLNVTGTNAAGVGWAAVYPSGVARPNVSNINLTPGATRANLAVVKVGTGGTVRVLVAETSADVIVDVFGYYGADGGVVMPVQPARVADTRHSTPLVDVDTRTFRIAGSAGVPADATAVVMNVTAVSPMRDGYLTVWPAGTRRPTASNVNFAAGQDVPNLVIVGLANGGVDVFNELGSTHVLLDVVGYVR